jgi:segregation and condensation protein B
LKAELMETEPQLNETLRRVEAVMFLARSPLSNRRIAQLAGLEDGTEARVHLKQLNAFYDAVGRSFHVKQVAGGYQLRTRPQFAQWLRKLEHLPAPSRLSGPALETLTVIAYRQPIIKAEIEAIRGVSCGEMIRQLLEKGLVRISGRSEMLGHPFLYSTTKLFLTTFGLSSLESLPRAGKMRGTGLPAWAEPAAELPPLAAEPKNTNTNTALDGSAGDNAEPDNNQVSAADSAAGSEANTGSQLVDQND